MTYGPIFVYRIPAFAHLPVDWESTVGYDGHEVDAESIWTYGRRTGPWFRTPAFSYDGAGHRLVVQDESAIVGIYFPPSPDDRPFVKFRLELGLSLPVMLGQNRGCVMCMDGSVARFGYEWTGEVFANVNHPYRPMLLRDAMFDEETGRCIISETWERVLVVDIWR